MNRRLMEESAFQGTSERAHSPFRAVGVRIRIRRVNAVARIVNQRNAATATMGTDLAADRDRLFPLRKVAHFRSAQASVCAARAPSICFHDRAGPSECNPAGMPVKSAACRLAVLSLPPLRASMNFLADFCPREIPGRRADIYTGHMRISI